MPYEALVKTAAQMAGHYSFGFETPGLRDEFVKRPDVWWYFYPEEDEFYFGSSAAEPPSWDRPRTGAGGWIRGGAWAAQLQQERDPARDAPHENQEVPSVPEPARPAAPEPESRW